MDLKLDEKFVKDMVSEALLRALDDNARNVLIQTAIQKLITPVVDQYTKRHESPLQAAFSYAIEHVAKVMVADVIAKDPIVSESIRKMVTDGFRRVVESAESDGLSESIAKSIAESLRFKERY